MKPILHVVVLLPALVGCLDRSRFNASCNWSEPNAAGLDVAKSDARRHLRNDGLLAEELGIRLSDSLHPGVFSADANRVRMACTDSLFALIARTHSVAIEDVRAAATQRDVLVDVALVLFPMIMVLWFAAARLADRVRRRFLPGEPTLALGFTLLMALAASGLWWVVGEQWSWMVEMLRLRDGHISYRAGRLPWYGFGVPLFVSGVFLFCWIAWSRWRREARGRLTRA